MIVYYDDDNFSIKLYRDYVKGKLVGLTEVIPIDELLEVWQKHKADTPQTEMNSKVYKLPNGKKAVFEYDVCGIGKITLECMDELMGMIADRPQGEWYQIEDHKVMGEGYMWHCSLCDHRVYQDSSADYPTENYCPHCGARMKGADDERMDR